MSHPNATLTEAGFSWEYPGFYKRGDFCVGIPEVNDGAWIVQWINDDGQDLGDGWECATAEEIVATVTAKQA